MALIDMGVTKSDLIVTFANNSIDYAIVLFASIWLGVTLYPVTPIANIYDLEVLFKSLDSFVLITSQSKVEIIERVLKKHNELKLKNVIVLDGSTDKYKTFDNLVEAGNNRKVPQIPYFKVDPLKDLFVLLQSSGTSGVPKSVMISHRAFLSTILNFMTSKIVENPVTAHVTPFGCISGVTFLFSYIPLGIPIVIYNQFSEQLILESIPKYKVSFMYFTPIFGYKLIDEEVVKKYDLSSLKHLFTGGSALPENVGKAIVRKHKVVLNECIYNFYE